LEAFDYKRSTKNKPNPNQKDDKTVAFYGNTEALCFLISGNKGSVYIANENGKFNKLYQMEAPIIKLLYNQDRQMLVTVTDSFMLGQYIFKSESEVENLMTVSMTVFFKQIFCL
jgi:hypothetical protein